MARWVFLAIPLVLSCGGSGGLSGGGVGADGGTADAGVSGLVAISLSQTDIRIPAGASTAFAVTGTFNDGSRRDVTPQAEVRSADTSVATVSKGPGSQIQVFAMRAGTTTVNVEVGSLEQKAAVTVTPR